MTFSILPDVERRLRKQSVMPHGEARSLTYGEWASLSTGLAEALRWAGAAPTIINRPALGARLAELWRGRTPIMAWGDRIYWPDALGDFSAPGDERQMALLQHELQHVLEFVTGELSAVGYLINPKNWIYRYELAPGRRWSCFGAEQRAAIVERLWLIERGLAPGDDLEAHLRMIPWANPLLAG